MTLQERKDTADIIAKEAEIVYKKSFLLLASAGGVGGYAIAQTGVLRNRGQAPFFNFSYFSLKLQASLTSPPSHFLPSRQYITPPKRF